MAALFCNIACLTLSASVKRPLKAKEVALVCLLSQNCSGFGHVSTGISTKHVENGFSGLPVAFGCETTHPSPWDRFQHRPNTEQEPSESWHLWKHKHNPRSKLISHSVSVSSFLTSFFQYQRLGKDQDQSERKTGKKDTVILLSEEANLTPSCYIKIEITSVSGVFPFSHLPDLWSFLEHNQFWRRALQTSFCSTGIQHLSGWHL